MASAAPHGTASSSNGSSAGALTDAPRPRPPRIALACDPCRSRKVKCDGQQPCASCRRSSYPCTYLNPPKRRQAKAAAARKPATTTAVSTLASASASASAPATTPAFDARRAIGHAAPSTLAPASAAPSLTTSAAQLAAAAAVAHLAQLVDPPDDGSDRATLVISQDPGSNGLPRTLRSLGHSSGLHIIRKWRTKASSNSTEAVMVLPPSASRARPATPSGPEAALPPRNIMTMLLDFYFEHMHAFVPVADQQMLRTSLDEGNPPLLLLNAVFAVSAHVFESTAQGPQERPTASDIFLNRARQLARNILWAPPCLEYIQALLLLSFHELGLVRGSGWVVSGVAIRMAQDMGLNRPLDHLAGAGISLSPIHRHFRRTWMATVIMDRFVSAVLGRPITIHDEDCDVQWPDPEAEPDPHDAQTLRDYLELAKLSTILGKILRHVNDPGHERRRAQWAAAVPDLHAALSEWLHDLPPRLRYSFHAGAPAPSRFAVFLNTMYYTAIILCYRVFLTPNAAMVSPLFPQYLHICSTAATAIVHICHGRAADLPFLPDVMLYPVFTAVSTLVVTYNCMAGRTTPRRASDGTADSGPRDAAPTPTAANALAALRKCHVVIVGVQEFWPLAKRLIYVLEDFFDHNGVPADVPRQPPSDVSKRERVPTVSRRCNEPDAIAAAYARLSALLHGSSPPPPSPSPPPPSLGGADDTMDGGLRAQESAVATRSMTTLAQLLGAPSSTAAAMDFQFPRNVPTAASVRAATMEPSPGPRSGRKLDLFGIAGGVDVDVDQLRSAALITGCALPATEPPEPRIPSLPVSPGFGHMRRPRAASSVSVTSSSSPVPLTPADVVPPQVPPPPSVPTALAAGATTTTTVHIPASWLAGNIYLSAATTGVPPPPPTLPFAFCGGSAAAARDWPAGALLDAALGGTGGDVPMASSSTPSSAFGVDGEMGEGGGGDAAIDAIWASMVEDDVWGDVDMEEVMGVDVGMEFGGLGMEGLEEEGMGGGGGVGEGGGRCGF
ncbi:hypothetical protein AMAG_00277 [Allomyces macrogynus ATCC 38327]|uniref:Zn(2)-C6 fungal-type domain-containing protein n=1 Tax=Allomyces macrogynus (strain ATCC 38327) TaxID=578462 RepID=A0A0L0RW14_ALLM3|nr:hypothetical protein AMAG_00277 [Allomyces macrogynus ATCC 38327]|eukprot:KNE54290.1 hypothetical protein AMAG_00277 [Allomyces macrogynus ATCC 38327]